MLTLVTSEILCFKGSIKKALQIAKDIGGQYGAYNTAECHHHWDGRLVLHPQGDLHERSRRCGRRLLPGVERKPSSEVAAHYMYMREYLVQVHE